MRTVSALRQAARQQFKQAPLEAPLREIDLLLGWVLGLSEAQLLARDQQHVAPEDAATFKGLLGRRLTGEPVAYLLGQREFFGREFSVDDRVLIPRPETEHLVESVLTLPLPRVARVLDLGTGSGCIATTLACERPDWEVTGCDRSLAALAVAQSNLRRHNRPVQLLAGDWSQPLLLTSFDLIVSNPPYVREMDRPELSHEVTDFEPPGALFGGEQGLNDYRTIFRSLAGTSFGGWIALELGLGQFEAVEWLARKSAFDTRPPIQDYAGIDRILIARRTRGASGESLVANVER